MKFCEKCGKKLIKTEEGDKCQKCDDVSIFQEKVSITEKNEIDSQLTFQFKKNNYYEQAFIRKKRHAHPQWGISQNPYDDSWTVIKNKENQTNVYYDRPDPKTGSYYYIGQGKKGNQDMSHRNLGLKNAKQNNQKIHLFWQYNDGSNHKYVGEVKVEDIKDEFQLDEEHDKRKVYVFVLKPIQNTS